jgi:hypothetical protein
MLVEAGSLFLTGRRSGTSCRRLIARGPDDVCRVVMAGPLTTASYLEAAVGAFRRNSQTLPRYV